LVIGATLKRGVPAAYAKRRAATLAANDPAAALEALRPGGNDEACQPVFETSGDWRD
jgi:hypothetical protein